MQSKLAVATKEEGEDKSKTKVDRVLAVRSEEVAVQLININGLHVVDKGGALLDEGKGGEVRTRIIGNTVWNAGADADAQLVLIASRYRAFKATLAASRHWSAAAERARKFDPGAPGLRVA